MLKLLKIINKITKIGTLRNIPLKPQNFPITLKVSSIISGLKLSDLPISFGSIKLPTTNWDTKRIIKRNNEFTKSRFWIREKIKGIITAINEPIKGIKFNRNAKIPKNTDRSLEKKNKMVKLNKPVNRLVTSFIWK